MYKSRVETFNQVHYFHHLIFFFLCILQDDDMRNKLQYFILKAWTEVQRWRRGRQTSNFRVCGHERSLHRWQVRWVHVPLEGSHFYDVHLSASACPRFQLAGRGGGELRNRIIQGHDTNTLPLCYWNDTTVIWSTLETKVARQEICMTLEWSELNRHLEASGFAKKWIYFRKLKREHTVFSVFFISVIMLVVRDTQGATDKCIYCFLEIRTKPLLAGWSPLRKEIQIKSPLSVHGGDGTGTKILQSLRLLKQLIQ